MGKSQVPRGVALKRVCPKCGAYYFPQLRGNSMQLTKGCNVCYPDQYIEEKKK